MSEHKAEQEHTKTPSGGSATTGERAPAVPVDGQSAREAATAPSEGYTDADAWRDNYYGMVARWAECDTERMRLKQELADTEVQLRLLREQSFWPDKPRGGAA